MGIEEIKSLQITVKQVLDSVKEIANNKPDTRITQSSVDTFNNILSEVHSMEEFKKNSVISKMTFMSIPSSMRDMAISGPKVVDLVTNLATIHGALFGYMSTHRRPIGRGRMENL